MNCSSCGYPLASASRFCSHCGAAIVYAAPVAPLYPPVVARPSQYNRVARHLQVLGILWGFYALSRITGGLFGLIFLHGLFGSHVHASWNSDMGPFASSWASALVPLVLMKTAVTVAAAAATAYALLTRQPWGRVLAIVVAIFSLIHPILGTVLGIYTLWVLAPAVCGMEYEAVVSGPRHASTAGF